MTPVATKRTGSTAPAARPAGRAREPGDQPMLLPIGHYIGAFHPAPGAPAEHHTVRVGTAPMRLLSDDELGVWAMAHGLTGEAAVRPWTRAGAIDVAEQAGIDDAAKILDELLADELLAEVVPETEQAVEFAESYRVVPLMFGVAGSVSERRRAIGLPGVPVVEVDNFSFELWRLGHLAGSLRDYCQLYGEGLRAEAGLSEEHTSLDQMLLKALWELQPLIAHNAVYLDAIRTW